MATGCRDCPACTKPALWRLLFFVIIGWTLLFVRPLLSTCPQCGHVIGRHARRADGSFRD